MKRSLLNLGAASGVLAGRATITSLRQPRQRVYSKILRDSEPTDAILFNPVGFGDLDIDTVSLETGEYRVDLFTYVMVSLHRRTIYPAATATLTIPDDVTTIQLFV